jgi:hypothetical protein
MTEYQDYIFKDSLAERVESLRHVFRVGYHRSFVMFPSCLISHDQERMICPQNELKFQEKIMLMISK